MNKHLVLDENVRGKDWIIGDLHGHLNHLLVLLNSINFDSTKDRLFSVGDLIDRGPQSLSTLEHFLNNDNWFMVRGNHEQLMIDSLITHDQLSTDCWLNNGGDWILSADRSRAADAAVRLKQTPLVITVGNGPNRFNIVHAELIYPERSITDEMIDNWDFDETAEYEMLWSRHIYDTYDYWVNQQHIDVNKNFHDCNSLSPTYVGHTTHFNQRPIRYEQHWYLDTGGGFFSYNDMKYKHRALLTAMSPQTGEYYTIDHAFNVGYNFNYST